VEEIHSQDPQRLLLLDRIAVEEVHVQEEGGRWLAWLGLEAQPDPAASVLIALWLPGGDRVREGKEGASIAPDGTEALDELLELAIEHRLETLPADVALRGAVVRVAHAMS
jgi:hypothetical protein